MKMLVVSCSRSLNTVGRDMNTSVPRRIISSAWSKHPGSEHSWSLSWHCKSSYLSKY